MPKLVSIIFPTDGKRKEFIKDSFGTLVYQTYQSWEVIIVKSESYNFEEELGYFYQTFKEKIRIINVPEDCGSGYARSIGVSNARGSYISYLDDDDLWSNTYLQDQVHELEQIGCDLVYCNYHLREQIYDDIERKYIQHFISIPYSVKSFDRNLLLIEPFIHLSTVVHVKDINDIVQFSGLQSLNDWKFLITASKFFRFHNNSKTFVTIQRRLDNTNSLTSFGNETIRNWKGILQENEKLNTDSEFKKNGKIILENFLESYNIEHKKEAENLSTILLNRGFELAYGYLKYLINIKKLDYNVCKIAYDICMLNNKEDLAKDMLYLSYWFNGEDNENNKEHILTYFKREYEQWIVLL